MLRALIVDDDEIFARYVKKCIDWDGLHTQLLGHARNGAQAVEMVHHGRGNARHERT